MPAVKTAYTTIVNIFSKQFYFFSALTSFIGLFLIFLKERWAVYTALSFFCIMLLIFTCYLIYALFKILEIRGSDHANKSTFVKYETSDGNIIHYEAYKLIQVKQPVMTEFEFSFKWTGTHLPHITSDLQQVINIVDENDPTKYDKALLKFKKPLYFNQNCVVHFKAELDDTDKKSKPHLEAKVSNEVDIIHFRVILKHKPIAYDKNAILEKCKIDSGVSPGFKPMREIPFDKLTKSYEYHLLNPEIGYYYRISWEK